MEKQTSLCLGPAGGHCHRRAMSDTIRDAAAGAFAWAPNDPVSAANKAAAIGIFARQVLMVLECPISARASARDPARARTPHTDISVYR
jgi:hypothetical protein